MNRAAFLDRDGVVNKRDARSGYITSVEDFQILPGVSEAISLLNRANYLVIIVTNQRCIAKELLSIAGLNQIHQKLTSDLAAAGARIDAIYYCPHDKEPPCNCRKPAPGMLLTAAAEHHIDLRKSWMIGDTDSDSKAGKQAGCRTIQLSRQPVHSKDHAELFAPTLLAAVQKILSTSEVPESA